MKRTQYTAEFKSEAFKQVVSTSCAGLRLDTRANPKGITPNIFL